MSETGWRFINNII